MTTFVSYPTQTGGQTVYTFPFPYVYPADVKCFIDGADVDPDDYTVGEGDVTFDTAPTGDLVIRRLTTLDAKVSEYAPSSPIKSRDLNVQNNQFWFSLQEIWEQGIGGLAGTLVTPGEGITVTDINNLLDQAVIDSPVVDQLLNDTQVNSQAIIDETQARLAAVAAETQARIDAINAEAAARQQALTDEQAARISALNGIQLQLDADVANLTALAADLDAEVASRIADVQALNDALTQEVADRINSAQTNANNLIQEILNRQNADQTLQSNVDAVVALSNQNAALVATEELARVTGDDILASQLNVVSAAANRVRTFYQAVEPTTGMEEGDLWFDTDDGNKAYRFDGVAWLPTDDTRIADALAQIAVETTARVTGDNALASQITSLTAQVGTNSADIIAVNEAVTSESSARATAISGLQTQVNGNAASIATNSTAISNETSARATAISALQTQVDNNAASITSEINARTTADTAFTSSLNALTARVGTNEADILTVNEAVTTESSARATAISGLQTQVNNNAASITSNATAISTEVSARTSQFNALQAEVDGNEAAILSEITARTNADIAIASDVSALTTRVGTAEADIVTNATAISTESSARATAISGLQTQVDSNEAAILSEQTARSTADSALASDITGLTTRVGTAETNIISNATAISTANSANATQFNSVNARIDTSELAELRGEDFTLTAERPTLWSHSVSYADMDTFGDPSASFGPYNALPAWQRSDKAYIGPRYGIPVAPGDRIKLRWRVEVLGNGTQGGSTFQSGAYGYSDPTTFSVGIPFGSDKLTVADGVTFVEHEATIPAGTYFIRPYLYVNKVEPEDAPVAVSTFAIANITREYDIEASVINESTARANGDSALASDVSGLQTRMGDAEADILTNQTAISNETSARATEVSALQTQINGNNAAIVSEANARSGADSALASDISGLTTRMTSAEAGVATNTSAISTESSARASAVSVINARYTTDAEALIASGNFSATFENDSFWGSSVSTDPDARFPPISSYYVEAEGQTVWQTTLQTYPATVSPFRVEPGDRIRIRWRGRVVDDGTQSGGTVGSYAYAFDADRVYIGGLVLVSQAKKTVADGSFSLETIYEVPAGTYYLWPYAYANLISGEDSLTRYFSLSVANENAAKAVEADVEAQIVSEASTRSSADSAIASDISTLTTRVGDAEASITNNATAISTATTARTTIVNEIKAARRGQGLGSNDFTVTAWEEDAWQANAISGTDAFAEFGIGIGSFTDTIYGRAWQLSSIGFLVPPTIAVNPGDTVRLAFRASVTVDGAGGAMSLATGIYGYNETGGAGPAVSWPGASITTADKLYEHAITVTVPAGVHFIRPYCYVNGVSGQTSTGNIHAFTFKNLTELSGVEASLTEVRDVLVDGNGDINAFYTLRTDVNGNIAGFGLSNDGTTSEFAILADKFLIARPGVGAAVPTFLVNGNGDVLLSGSVSAQSFKATKAGSSKSLILEEGGDYLMWYGASGEASPAKANADIALGSDGLMYVGGSALGSLATRSSVTSGAPVTSTADFTPAATRITEELVGLTTVALEAGSSVDIAADFGVAELFGITPNCVLINSSGTNLDIFLRLYRDYDGTKGTRTMLEENAVQLGMVTGITTTSTGLVNALFRYTDSAHGGGAHDYCIRIESERSDNQNPQSISMDWRNIKRSITYLERKA